MSQRGHAIQRHYSTLPQREPEARPASEPRGDAAIKLVARALCEADPIGASREYAAGLSIQPRGGRISAICRAVAVLAEGDPTIVAGIVNNLLVEHPQAATAGEA